MKKLVYTAVLSVIIMMTIAITASAGAADRAEIMGHTPDGELIVANVNATDSPYNAKGDGITDDTDAIQKALNAVKAGGTVYLPAGTYVVRGKLEIPEQCTLIGDWLDPGETGERTLLLAYANRGKPSRSPFISLGCASTLTGIAVYYPEQTASDIAEYPPTISFSSVSCYVDRVILYNSWYGIRTDAFNGSAQHVFRVWGTPLSLGISVGLCLEVSEFAYIHFSTDIWAKSGMEGAPADAATLAAVRKYTSDAEGIICGRGDDIMLWDIDIDPEDYGTGLRFYLQTNDNSTLAGGSYGHVFKLNRTLLNIEETSTFGVSLDIVDDICWQYGYGYTRAADFIPAGENIVSVTDSEFGAAGDGVTDDTAAFKAAIAHIAGLGGGIVYVPAGEFVISEGLTLPAGTELRGALNGITTAITKKVSRICVVQNETPAFTLSANSSLRGLSVVYPEQSVTSPAEYPPTVVGEGSGVYVANCCFINSYDMIDFSRCACNGFVIADTWGTALNVGIKVGGGTAGGCIENTLVTYGVWLEVMKLHGSAGLEALMAYSQANTVSYEFGDCSDITGWSVFAFYGNIGVRFADENGHGIRNSVFCRLGLDTPRAEYSAKIESAENLRIYGVSTASYNQYGIFTEPGMSGPVSIYGQNTWAGCENSFADPSSITVYEPEDTLIYGGTNICAEVRRAVASSENIELSGHARKATDGRCFSEWISEADDPAPTLTLELGDAETIAAISYSGFDAENVTVSYSTDGEIYTDAVITKVLPKYGLMTLEPVNAEYFRFSFNVESGSARAADIRLLTYAPEPPADPDDGDTDDKTEGNPLRLALIGAAAVAAVAAVAAIVTSVVKRRKKGK